MGQNFTIDNRHKDVCYDIYKSNNHIESRLPSTFIYNNDNNSNSNSNNNDNNNNNSKIALNKSNSNLSKITTATNTSGNSTGSYNDIHNYDGYQEDYSSSNEDPATNDPWGFFEDIEPESDVTYFSDEELYCERKLQRASSLPPPLTEPPYYILESTLRTQKLWHITAGRRPKQPSCERKAMEKIWSENFKASNVVYEKIKEKPAIVKSVSASAQIQTSTKYKINTKIPLTKSGNVIYTLEQCLEDDEVARKEFDVDIIMRGYQPFSNPCSKSFNVDIGPSSDSISCITLQIPRFRIIKNKNNQEYAEFLVVIVLGGYSSVKFGLWRRYSDFHNLVAKIEHYHMIIFAIILIHYYLGNVCYREKNGIAVSNKSILDLNAFY